MDTLSAKEYGRRIDHLLSKLDGGQLHLQGDRRLHDMEAEDLAEGSYTLLGGGPRGDPVPGAPLSYTTWRDDMGDDDRDPNPGALMIRWPAVEADKDALMYGDLQFEPGYFMNRLSDQGKRAVEETVSDYLEENDTYLQPVNLKESEPQRIVAAVEIPADYSLSTIERTKRAIPHLLSRVRDDVYTDAVERLYHHDASSLIRDMAEADGGRTLRLHVDDELLDGFASEMEQLADTARGDER